MPRGSAPRKPKSTGFQEPELEKLTFLVLPRGPFRVFGNPASVTGSNPRDIRNHHRVFGNHHRVIGNAGAGFQERQLSGFQEPGRRVIRNRPAKNLINPLLNSIPTPSVTRARDLNPNINSVTTTHRLLGGSAPCRLKPTHPAYPLKDRPTAEPKIKYTPRRRPGRRENETSNGIQAR